MFNIFNLVFRP